MSHDHAVEVRALRKVYGLGPDSVTAVDGIDFTVQRGEVFALLGPNGAGESSTIEILEGYHDRTGGEVSVLGVDPQHTHGRALLAWKARLTTLSGGQRRRVDVACGVIGHPELIFLDEPTTGFDPEARPRW